ncbi:hypothetical protein L1987_01429 [Smallanthus sonchifolius]|uniref:Uncharacterized protein n=1 Tax=Smallanthus sonchifolius TaxID=185202 RepID=A0ACB9K4U9_9ASTR|nr:hypothetical protein L1987_01429 [Smallanthus sonchifolius]
MLCHPCQLSSPPPATNDRLLAGPRVSAATTVAIVEMVYVMEQSFIWFDSNEDLQLIITMHEMEKELTIYAMTNNNIEVVDEPQGEGEEGSDYSLNDESYHSNDSNEVEL